MTSEMGDELKVSDLRERTVVVLMPTHRPEMVTMWVKDVADDTITFYGGAIYPPMHLILFRQPDGTLKDDAGHQIRVFQYLGKV